MPLSQANTNFLPNQQGSHVLTSSKKRRLSEVDESICDELENNSEKYLKMEEELSQEKKSNFSVGAASNGFTKHGNSLAGKPGATKKLVIKNFKGTLVLNRTALVPPRMS